MKAKNMIDKMTPEQFCYWLQGFAELQAAGDFEYMAPDEEQWEMIVEHLQTVFRKVTGITSGSTTYTLPSLPRDFGNTAPAPFKPFQGPPCGPNVSATIC